MRVASLLKRALTPPPQTWAKHDLSDTVFFLRVFLSLVLGMSFGAVGGEGLMVFLSFIGVNLFVGNAWLSWQGIDQADYENPEVIAQSPLAYEGFGPSVSMFVLFWVVTFTIAHA